MLQSRCWQMTLCYYSCKMNDAVCGSTVTLLTEHSPAILVQSPTLGSSKRSKANYLKEQNVVTQPALLMISAADRQQMRSTTISFSQQIPSMPSDVLDLAVTVSTWWWGRARACAEPENTTKGKHMKCSPSRVLKFSLTWPVHGYILFRLSSRRTETCRLDHFDSRNELSSDPRRVP